MNFTDELVRDYENMVFKVSWKYTQDQDLLKDLMQEGFEGLRKACVGFDSSKKIKFSTYAYTKIEGQIIQYINYNVDIVHIPIAHKKKCYTEEITDEEYNDKDIELTMDLDDALSLLDKKIAEVIILHHIKGFTKLDISKKTGINRNKIAKQIKNGMEQLKIILTNGCY